MISFRNLVVLQSFNLMHQWTKYSFVLFIVVIIITKYRSVIETLHAAR